MNIKGEVIFNDELYFGEYDFDARVDFMSGGTEFNAISIDSSQKRLIYFNQEFEDGYEVYNSENGWVDSKFQFVEFLNTEAATYSNSDSDLEAFVVENSVRKVLLHDSNGVGLYPRTSSDMVEHGESTVDAKITEILSTIDNMKIMGSTQNVLESAMSATAKTTITFSLSGETYLDDTLPYNYRFGCATVFKLHQTNMTVVAWGIYGKSPLINGYNDRVSEWDGWHTISENEIGILSSLETTANNNLVAAINEVFDGLKSKPSQSVLDEVTADIDELNEIVGDNNNLVTHASNLVDAINAIDQLVNRIKEDVGALGGLNTTDNTSIVVAINEVQSEANNAQATAGNASIAAQEAKDSIGDLGDLHTADKSSLVAAINEVQSTDITSTDDILAAAIALPAESKKTYWLSGTRYTGNILAGSYNYGCGTVFKRSETTITVVLWGINGITPAANYYNGSAWSGWKLFSENEIGILSSLETTANNNLVAAINEVFDGLKSKPSQSVLDEVTADIDELNEIVGDNNNLVTHASNLVDAINAIDQLVNRIKEDVGALGGLNTTDNTSIVVAINEVLDVASDAKVIATNNSNTLNNIVIPELIKWKLPTVTTADNGKCLMVVDGKWTVVNFPINYNEE